jgi:hypothetical protein
MNKQKSAGVVAMIIAVVAITGAFAGSNHAREGSRAEANDAFPSATPPAKKAADKIVATCNTAKGCEALKDACKSLKKHSFKATEANGSLGVCIDQTFNPTSTFYLRNSNPPKQPAKTPAADVGLAAPKNTSEATLYCHGTVICRKVKNICAALGGNYTPIYDLSGSCSY